VPGERAARTGQIVGVVVVTVAAHERLDRHPEEAGGLPRVGTCLHQPSRRRVAHHMRRHVRAETRIFHQRGIITGEFRSA
jgi:hypothetical protein